MKRKRRQDGIELNFDGLADAVTNLVGTLILLVVLVMGLTGDKPSPHGSPGEKTGALPSPPARDASQVGAGPGSKEVREVVLRPPLEHATPKPGLFVICENNRVSIVGDNEQIVRGARQAKVQRGARISLPSGDFDLQAPPIGQLKALRKATALGESLAELATPDSRFYRFLWSYSASEFHVHFDVYPDSFPVFRRARQLAWAAKYEAGWKPLVARQTITFGAGGGSNVVQ